MDIISVIYLGHTREQPLISSASELVDGLEPHGLKQSVVQHPGTSGAVPGCGQGCTRGGRLGGYREGAIPGNQHEARLRLIYGILEVIGSYGRLTGFYIIYSKI